MKREDIVVGAKALFATLTIDEVNAVLADIRKEATAAKANIRSEAKKAAKAEAQAKTAEVVAVNLKAINELKEGNVIIVTIGSGKNEENVEVSFVKKTDKRFTVEVDGKKQSVMFHKFVGLAGDALTADEQAETDQEFPADSVEVDSDEFVEEETSVEQAAV